MLKLQKNSQITVKCVLMPVQFWSIQGFENFFILLTMRPFSKLALVIPQTCSTKILGKLVKKGLQGTTDYTQKQEINETSIEKISPNCDQRKIFMLRIVYFYGLWARPERPDLRQFKFNFSRCRLSSDKNQQNQVNLTKLCIFWCKSGLSDLAQRPRKSPLKNG